ncbi:MAG: hypothetical protein M3282_02980, partial [Gemmatimonadota bacterium]|nr:hypothetical protein [Gemmatimonadota bacterium]
LRRRYGSGVLTISLSAATRLQMGRFDPASKSRYPSFRRIVGSNPTPSASAEEPPVQAVPRCLDNFAARQPGVKSDNGVPSCCLLTGERVRR